MLFYQHSTNKLQLVKSNKNTTVVHHFTRRRSVDGAVYDDVNAEGRLCRFSVYLLFCHAIMLHFRLAPTRINGKNLQKFWRKPFWFAGVHLKSTEKCNENAKYRLTLLATKPIQPIPTYLFRTVALSVLRYKLTYVSLLI